VSFFFVSFLLNFISLTDIWSRETGRYETTLEGNKQGVVDVCWHPSPQQSLLASCSTHGVVCIWRKPVTENWSAYAPGFKELEENVVYHEREDEFGVLFIFRGSKTLI
jgi:COMPASS component SWD1